MYTRSVRAQVDSASFDTREKFCGRLMEVGSLADWCCDGSGSRVAVDDGGTSLFSGASG